MTAKAAESDSTSSEAESRTSARRPVRPVLLGLVIVPGLLLVGYMVGLGSSWSAHDPTVVEVNVEHVPADVPWGLFIHDGDQVQFRLDDVVWRSADQSDDGGTIPTCLRQDGASAQVEVGMIEVNRPFGSGSYWQVLSLTCPAS